MSRIFESFALEDHSFRSTMISSATVILIACAVNVVFAFGLAPGETALYYGYAQQMLGGNWPYSDFSAEYPPVAMAIFLIAGILSWNATSFEIVYGIMTALALLMGSYLIYRIVENYTDRPKHIVWAFLLFLLIMYSHVFDRYDIFPVVMVLGALYCLVFLKGKETLGWILLALAVMTKLYPAVLAPVLAIWMIRNGRLREVFKGAVICIVVCVMCMVPFFIADPSTAFSYVTYHSERGLQTESLPASVIELLSMVGLTDISYVFDYGSYNIHGAVPDAVAKFIIPLMAVCLIALLVIYWMSSGRRDRSEKSVIVACMTATLIFVIINKVFSPQYIIWFLPYLIILMGMYPESSMTIGKVALVLTILTHVQLTLNLQMYYRTGAFGPIGILLLLIRNIIVLLLLWACMKACAKGSYVPEVEAPDVQ